MKIKNILYAALMMLSVTSCDEHREFPDTAMKTCDILCTDGMVVRYEVMKSQGKKPIAVVFHINQNEDLPGTGYAVYLWDIAQDAYCDSIGMKQSTVEPDPEDEKGFDLYMKRFVSCLPVQKAAGSEFRD